MGRVGVLVVTVSTVLLGLSAVASAAPKLKGGFDAKRTDFSSSAPSVDMPSSNREFWIVEKGPCDPGPLCLLRELNTVKVGSGDFAGYDSEFLAPTIGIGKAGGRVFEGATTHAFAGNCGEGVTVTARVKVTEQSKRAAKRIKATLSWSWPDSFEFDLGDIPAGTATAKYKGKYAGQFTSNNRPPLDSWEDDFCTSI